jgi:hypothetical protein
LKTAEVNSLREFESHLFRQFYCPASQPVRLKKMSSFREGLLFFNTSPY